MSASVIDRRPRRRLARVVTVLVVALLSVLAAATAASAHATLVTSTPGNGDVLESAPGEITLTFTESITLGPGYVRVIDADGDRVDTGNVQIDGETASLALEGNLPDGGYIVSYRIVSADSHPVSGGISFAVGDAAPPEIGTNGTQIDGASDDPLMQALYPIARWVGYAGLALLAGVLLMALLDPAVRGFDRTRRVGWVGFDLALGATVVGGLLQGPYAAGRGLDGVVDPALISATLETTLGKMIALRLMLLGVLGVLLWEWFNARADRRALTWTAAAGVVAIAATYAASGHAVADGTSWASIPLTGVHLAAASAWIGGLLALLSVVFARRVPLSGGERQAIAARFSALAGWLVAALVVAGLAQAWLRVGSWGALFGTRYGWLLVGKSVLVVLAVGAAAYSRQLVQRRALAAWSEDAAPAPVAVREVATDLPLEAPDEDWAPERPAPLPGPVARLRRALLVEAAAGAAAIALAAVLVATPPAKDTYSVARDTVVTFDNSYTAQLSLDPGRTGVNTLHLYLFDRSGALADVDEVAVTVANAAQELGPIELTARNVGQGHFIADGVELPVAGAWTVSITFTEPGFGAVTDEGDIDVG